MSASLHARVRGERAPHLRVVGPPPEEAGDAVELLDGGAEAFPRMLAAISRASRRVHLEVYSFKRDAVGERFIRALAEAAARGVEVTGAVDGWGSARDGEDLVSDLQDAGCAIRLYNPIRAMVLGRFRRNHRKLLLVDDEVAFIGGINIGEEYGGPLGWADLAVEIRGPACVWLGRKLRGERPGPPSAGAHILLSGRGGGGRLRRRYLKAIGSAQHCLLIAHAYFLPDRHLVRSIRAAARRGVEVTLLLPGHSDVPFAREASLRLYGPLLAAGVRIREWQRSVLHAKAAVVDGRIALVGSFNLDPLSLENLEALVEVRAAPVAERLEACLRRWETLSRPVEPGPEAQEPALERWTREVLGGLGVWFDEGVARLLAHGRRARAHLTRPRSER